MRFTATLAAFGACLFGLTGAQQYAGDYINNTLPGVPGSEIAYWKIMDGKLNNLTMINYINHGSDNKRLVPSKIKRAVVIIHGNDRDPGTYESNMLSALAQLKSSEINTDSVAILAPYFPNGEDKGTGYPWISGLKANQGSITNCLVWSGSQWSAGGINQYPYKNVNTSSYNVLDQIIQYFDNSTLFPNMHQIVIAGHSLGGQTVQRYAALGQQLNTRTPVSYWVANPDSYVWLSTDRPLSTASCPTYDNYREGYTNFTQYPMTYGANLVAQGRSAILANFNSKAVNYARGTLDLGNDASTCAPETAGANRNERFFNFIKAFPVSCADPTGRNCDTVDFIAAGHDGGAMMASAAGQARLFTDNWSGNGSRAYDFGYPRQQPGDDPYPNPSLNTSSATYNNNTYAGNMTYQGCWSDQSPATFTYMAYTNTTGNTIELCTSTCAQQGYKAAGLEFGTQCFCGNSLTYEAQEVIDSSCATACPGNSSEICGGGNRISLFSNGVPVVNSAPGTPETVDSDFVYENCYTEATGGARALAAKGTSGSFVDLEYCANFCTGYKYFGTEYADECYCGNSLGTGANVTSSGDCSMTCAHNNVEFCGAGNRLTVYQNTSWVAPSSTSASAGTSATSTASGSSSTGVSCPASNNTIVASGGLNFTIECGIDHSGGDLTSLSTSTFQGCIDACSANAKCVDVSLSGSACYLKSTLGAAVSNGGVWGAKLVTSSSSSSASSVSGSTTTLNSSTASGSATSSVSATGTSSTISSSASASATPVSCPGSDGTTVTSNGLSFLIECGTDHSGGDLTSLSVSSFQQCIDTCAQNPSCKDVSLSGSACYLKSSVGAAISNGVWGARLVASTSSSTSSSASLSSSSVTSSSSSTLSTSSSSASTSSGSSSTVSTTSSSVSSSVVSTPSTTTTSASASATPLSCPASNSTTYVSNGASFLIECGIDHSGGDMSSLSVSSFEACIAACATTTGCVDVSLSGSACYLKSSVGAATNNGVLGAKLIAASATSSSVVPSTTSSSSSDTSTSVSTSTSSLSTSSTSSVVTSTTSSPSSSLSSSTSSVSNSTSSPSSTVSSTSSTSSSSSSVASSTSSTSTAPSSTASSTSSVSSSSAVLSTSPSTSTSSSTASSSTDSSTSSTLTTSSSSSSSSVASTTTLGTSTSSSSTSSSASASATALHCPASNGTLYTAPSNGNTFLVECGIDHSGGNLKMVYVSNFTQCVQTCDTTSGCVDVSLSGTACYMKKSVGAAISNGGVYGAKLVTSGTASATATPTA